MYIYKIQYINYLAHIIIYFWFVCIYFQFNKHAYFYYHNNPKILLLSIHCNTQFFFIDNLK